MASLECGHDAHEHNMGRVPELWSTAPPKKRRRVLLKNFSETRSRRVQISINPHTRSMKDAAMREIVECVKSLAAMENLSRPRVLRQTQLKSPLGGHPPQVV
jgi:hypothetical protein